MSLNFTVVYRSWQGSGFHAKNSKTGSSFHLQKKNQAVPDPHLCARNIKPIPDLMVIAGIFVCYSCL
jgi:hypothetical protein